MINESILSRLKDLKHQGKLKKYNISVTSKNNNFGDVVKFFAQINKNDVIQKISFKATGCTAFIAVCSYFCEMIEGKTIANALKIGQDQINSIVNLDSSREHVLSIILGTFALLIKKYRKGIETKTITPCEIEELIFDKEIKKTASTKKSSSINKEVKTEDNKSSKIVDKKSAIKDNKLEIKSQDKNVEKKIDKSSSSKTKSKKEVKSAKALKGNNSKKDSEKNNDVEIISEEVFENSKKINTNVNLGVVENKPTGYTVGDISDSLFQDEIKEVHSNHLANLQNMVNNQDDGSVVVESNVEHTHNLSYLLQKYTDDKAKKTEHKTTITKTTTTTKTISVSSNLDNNTTINVDSARASLDDLRKVNDEKNVARDTIEILTDEPKKKKKSFLDMFRKKK